MAAVPGIESIGVTAWMHDRAGAQGPISFTPLAGGFSNLTFLLEDASGRRWVLRRPPLGHVLATAHDMAREFRIQSALQHCDVPVPGMVGLCEDLDVNGAPFYVMEFVDGLIVRARVDVERVALVQRGRAADSLIETLARLHTTDVARIGLGDLARSDGYIERQLKRWSRQLADTRTRAMPFMDDVFAMLTERLPEQSRTALLHGDYRLDNVVLDDDMQVVAVLDWELSTLGDPLADLGLALAYWTQDDDEPGMPAWGTDLEGFPSRSEFATQYAERTGFDVADLSYYIAFAHWKVACISEGVYSRYQAGVMGDSGVDMALLERHPLARAEAAHRILRERAQRSQRN